jgi:hypothetical protein
MVHVHRFHQDTKVKGSILSITGWRFPPPSSSSSLSSTLMDQRFFIFFGKADDKKERADECGSI